MSAREEVQRVGIAQLRARLGVSGRTVSRWCAAGSFPRWHYIGGRRKWFLAEVEEWEALHAGPPPELEQRVAGLQAARVAS